MKQKLEYIEFGEEGDQIQANASVYKILPVTGMETTLKCHTAM